MASKVKASAGSFERLMLPRLNSIDGDLKAINTRIDSVERSQDSLKNEIRAEVKAGFASQDAKVEKLVLKLEEMDKKLDIDRRMTIIEAKVKELEKKD
jgi:septal ring factor EnvC (AmiA/AmiB activator)